MPYRNHLSIASMIAAISILELSSYVYIWWNMFVLFLRVFAAWHGFGGRDTDATFLSAFFYSALHCVVLCWLVQVMLRQSQRRRPKPVPAAGRKIVTNNCDVNNALSLL